MMIRCVKLFLNQVRIMAQGGLPTENRSYLPARWAGNHLSQLTLDWQLCRQMVVVLDRSLITLTKALAWWIGNLMGFTSMPCNEPLHICSGSIPKRVTSRV